MTILTLDSLKQLGACREQVDKFEAAFGQQVDVTPENCEKYAEEFDFLWYGLVHLLPAAARYPWEEFRTPIITDFDHKRCQISNDYSIDCLWQELTYYRTLEAIPVWRRALSRLLGGKRTAAEVEAKAYLNQAQEMSQQAMEAEQETLRNTTRLVCAQKFAELYNLPLEAAAEPVQELPVTEFVAGSQPA